VATHIEVEGRRTVALSRKRSLRPLPGGAPPSSSYGQATEGPVRGRAGRPGAAL
jgi:hypothetical protein